MIDLEKATSQAVSNELRSPLPPFTEATARQKVQAAEDGWNSRNPERVSMAYTIDSRWRNRSQFIQGRDEIQRFLADKWTRELDYKLEKTLWSYTDNRIAVTFEYEWRNEQGQWYRSYGNELWEFDANGFMQHRIASINDLEISATERRLS